MTERCHLCAQSNHDASADLVETLLGPSGHQAGFIVSERTAIIPSIGGLAVGHVLVVPRFHVSSLLCTSSSYLNFIEHELTWVRDLLSCNLRAPIHDFEHGMGFDSVRTPCSVAHAHLHLVPATVDIRSTFDNEWLELPRCSLFELKSMVKGREYIYYRSPDGRIWLSVGSSRPSQFMRRVFAEALGIPDEWNWRATPRLSQLSQTIALMRTIERISKETIADSV